MNSLYDFVTAITDKRLPSFSGVGVKRSGAQVHLGRGKGKFFLCQVLSVQKRNGKWAITNTPY